MSRIVCNFSAGAASAVATKLTLAKHPDAIIVSVWIKEEHPDNDRFRADCEKWFGKPIIILKDEKYGASVREVWRRHRFIKSNKGAKCTMLIKRAPLEAFSLPGDIKVLGYTAEEVGRRDDFLEHFPNVQISTPLIDLGITKSDCLAMVERAGIEIPVMYQLGFNNNNCVACGKGGMGYFNHTRKVFPEDFAEVAEIQKNIGVGANLHVHDGRRISLLELPLDAGRHDEPIAECSMLCELAEMEYSA